MLKTLARLESIVENRVGHFFLDHDTPINVAKEMCLNFLKYLGQVEDHAKAQQEAQAISQSPIEELVQPEEIKTE